jgi:tRNA(Ile)-lysidine synthase
VEDVAADAGLDFFGHRARDLAGPNLHARARDVRYRFLAEVSDRVGAQRIATGHTLDDRVETLLARLVHGGATEALASIPPAAGPRIRPLLEIRRAETEAYCRARGLDFYVDESNDDPRFDRARVRNSLLAAIEDGWGAGAVASMATAAEHLREDADALSAMAVDLAANLTTIEDDRTIINRRTLEDLPRALRRRVLELALGHVRDRVKAIDATLDALDADPPSGSRFAVAGGSEIVIQRDTIQIYPASVF